MNTELKQLKKRAIDLIKNPSLDSPSLLARLAPLPAKIQHLELQLQQIEDEKSRIEKLLLEFSQDQQQLDAEGIGAPKDGFAGLPNNRRRDQKKLRIEIDVSKLGLFGAKRIISEHKASDSLVNFLVFLYETKGISILEKLSRFSVNRGVLVSKDPARDYRYISGNGEAEYQYQPISDSGFSALTQSATKEKVSDIRNAWQFLNLPSGALNVTEVEK